MRNRGSSGPSLVVRHTGQRFPLAGAPVSIGRQEDNTIVLTDGRASRHHAVISQRMGTYLIEDLDSANGTYVNDREIAGLQTLRDGDTVRVGNTILDVHLAAADRDATLAGELRPPAPGYQAGGPATVQAALGPRMARESEADDGRSPWFAVIIGLLAVGILVLAGGLIFFLLRGPGGKDQPAVTILSPAAGSQVALGSQLALQANASGAQDLTRLDLTVDNVLVATVTSPDAAGTGSLSVSAPWVFGQPGAHVVAAQAHTAGGETSPQVSVSVLVVETVAQGTVSPGAQPTAAQPTDAAPTAEAATAQPSTEAPPTAEPPTEPSAEPSAEAPPTEAPPTMAPPTVAPTSSGGGGATRPAGPGLITDMETFGTWKRGDQPNGTFTQSSEQAHSGSYSGKLAYNFPTTGNDFVVFEQTHLLGGRPNQVSAWVYGDNSKHYLNIWIQDAAGETWQFPLGQIKHNGWQQMFARLDPGAAWPAGHIDGPSNGALDYPINFRALVMDDVPDSYTGSGAIYIDDLRCDETSAPPPAPTPTYTVTPKATVAPVIQFWADDTSINSGERTFLRWHVENVQAIYLDGAPVTGPDGQQRVRPNTTTTYRLRVVYAGGEQTLEVTISVH